jgi:predicted PurR-regulated permease PerM
MADSSQKLASRAFVITLAVIAAVLAASSALYFLYAVRAIVLDLVIALVLAAALQPMVGFLVKKKWGKISAAS